MAILGNTLKEKREALGLTLAQVSKQLEIQERFLIALENENLEIIPNEYYVKAFLKQYGDLLKIDGEKLLDRYYKEQKQLEKEKAEKQKQEALQKQREEQEKIRLEKERIENEKLEKLKRQQAVENLKNKNLSNMDRPDLFDLEEDNATQVVRNTSNQSKSKWSKYVMFPLVVITGIGTAYLLYSTMLTPSQKVETTTRVESTTTTQSETSTTEVTTSSTVESTTESTIESIVESTTVQTATNAVESPAAQNVEEYPSGANAIYVKSKNNRSVVYGLGSAYKNYTGNYNFTINVTEPTWISVTIHNKVIYEGTITSRWRFHTLNTAANAIVKTGKASATTITMNNTTIPVPKTTTVQTITVDLKR